MEADTFACISQYVALATGDCDVLADGVVVGCRRSLRGNREISRSTVRQLPPVRIGKAKSRSR
jgi:hypothetical protein